MEAVGSGETVWDGVHDVDTVHVGEVEGVLVVDGETTQLTVRLGLTLTEPLAEVEGSEECKVSDGEDEDEDEREAEEEPDADNEEALGGGEGEDEEEEELETPWEGEVALPLTLALTLCDAPGDADTGPAQGEHQGCRSRV